MRRLRSLSVFALTLTMEVGLGGCAGESETMGDAWEVAVAVASELSAEDEALYSLLEGDIVHIQAWLEPAENMQALDLDHVKVVWVSDVAGVLTSAREECVGSTAGEAAESEHDDQHGCWLTDFEIGANGNIVWPMVTSLPLGTHLVRARAFDLSSGAVLAESGATVFLVEPRVPPDVHLLSPTSSVQVAPGETFDVEAWIASGSDEGVEVTLATSSGPLVESSVGADGIWAITCHAGVHPDGEGEEPDCQLPPGGQILVLTATDGRGVSSHAFASVTVEQDHE